MLLDRPRLLPIALAGLLASAFPQVSRAQAVVGGGFASFGGVGRRSGDTLITAVTANLVQGRIARANLSVESGGQADEPLAVRARFSTPASLFQLVAIPTANSATRLGSLYEELGAPSGDWRFGHYSPTSDAYDTSTTVRAGAGYWLIARGAKTITYGVPPVAPEAYSVALTSGATPLWNQVGNPFPFPVRVSDLRIAVGAGAPATIPASGAAVSSTLDFWKGDTAYVPVTVSGATTTTVAPYEGFWIEAQASPPGAVRLIFPFATAAPAPPAPPAAPADASWWVALAASQGALRASPVTLAASRDGIARATTAEPADPPLPEAGLRATLSGDGAGGPARTLLVPPGDQAAATLELAGAQAPGEVALAVSSAGLPSQAALELVDDATGEARALPASGTLTLPARAQAARYTLRVQVAGASAPLESGPDRLRYAYPNPTSRGVGLAFALARPGPIAIEVLDVSGRLVREARLGSLGAGDHVWVWDGLGRDGAGVPPGVYLARWHAGAASGTVRLVRLR